MKKIVQKLNVRSTCRTHDFETFGDGSEKIFGILFGVDIFKKNSDIFGTGDLSSALQTLYAIVMQLLVTLPGDLIAGQNNQFAALELFEHRQLGAHFCQEGFPLGGIAQTMGYAAAGVDGEIKFALPGAKFREILFAEIFVFLDQLDSGVARLGYFFESLLERKFLVHRPQHYGEREGGYPRGLLFCRHARNGGWRTGGSDRGSGARATKLPAPHVRPPPHG